MAFGRVPGGHFLHNHLVRGGFLMQWPTDQYRATTHTQLEVGMKKSVAPVLVLRCNINGPLSDEVGMPEEFEVI